MSWLEEFGREHNATTSAGVAGAVSGGTPTFNTIEEYQAYEAANAPKKAKKSKNFWLDQISTGGGIAGSLGGAALGTAILPGIGTILGGILGGAAGSAGGQVGENAIAGDELMQDVGTEALYGGVTGVPIFGTAKGLLGAGKALIGGAGKAAANTALQKALGVGASKVAGGVAGKVAKSTLENIGETWGVQSGKKVAGRIITPQKARTLTKFIQKNIGITGGSSAKKVLEKSSTMLDDTGKAIKTAITSASGVDKKALSDVIKAKLKGSIGVDEKSQVAKDILSRIKNSKSTSELWDLRKELDKNLINWGKNPQSTVAGAENIAKTARAEINKVLNAASPEFKKLNSQYSNLKDITELVAPSARNPKGINLPIIGKVGGEASQTVKSGIGALTGKGASTISGIGNKIPTGLIGATARQFGGRALGGQDMGTQPMPDTQMPTSTTDMMGGQSIQEPAQSSNPYPREALLYDIQRDPKNATKYIAYYQNLQEVFPAQESAKYSSVIAGNISDFQSSLNELNNLSGAITSGSGSVDPIMGRIRSMNPYDVDQQTLQAMIDKTRQIVGKALEGGVLRKEDEEKYKKILPTTSDTKATALNKIAMIQAQLNQKMQSYQSMVSGGATSSLEDALMQSQNQTNYNNTGSY